MTLSGRCVRRGLRTGWLTPSCREGRDIFERIYAVRLDRIRRSEECRAALAGRDPGGLLGPAESAAADKELSDEELLAELGGVSPAAGDVTRLVHVRSREEIHAAEEVAQRTPCPDFDTFRPVFEKAQRDLDAGVRRTARYKNDDAAIREGDLFVLDGQKALVADLGERFMSEFGRQNSRLRVVFDNGTESNLLQRSLQRALYKDEASRRILEADAGPLFSGVPADDDQASGTIYVLRSQSDHPFVVEHRSVLHKIGVTGGDLKARLANARKDPTFLLADVEVVTTYKLVNIDRTALEDLLHRFFDAAKLVLRLQDRFGWDVEPREWYLVPLPAIQEAMRRIQDGTIDRYRYDAATATLVEDRACPPGLTASPR